MPKPLTPRQTQIVRFIRRHIAKHGYPPSLKEIGSDFGITAAAAAGHLDAVAKKGVLRRQPNQARAITLTGDDDHASDED